MGSALVNPPRVVEPSGSDYCRSDSYTFFMTAEELSLYIAETALRCAAYQEQSLHRGYHRGRRGKALSSSSNEDDR